MSSLSTTRKRMIAALAAMAVICIACAIFLWAPVTESPAQLTREAQEARQELHSKQRQVAPLENLDQKLETAKQQISEFKKERLPARYSELSEQIDKLANSSGVRLSGLNYLPDEAVHGLQPIKINATLSGNYANVVKFINAAERNKVFLLVDQVGLAERQQGEIGLQITLETYLTREKVPTKQAGD